LADSITGIGEIVNPRLQPRIGGLGEAMLSVFCACMVPLVFLMQKPLKGTKAAVH
jgi:hypothetical protein